MELWRGKVAVVTGASAGIGVAICKDLCKHGIKVVGLARRLQRLEEVKAQILEADAAAHFYPFKCDLTSQEDIDSAFNFVQETLGGVDILVNNAGVAEFTSLLDEDNLERIQKVINTNLVGNICCTKKAHKSMVERDVPGYIINISSVMGHAYASIPGVKPIMNVYAPTKFALTALNQVVRNELHFNKQSKIRVSNVSPGATKTEIFEVGGLDLDTKDFGGELSFMDPEDVADVVIYLLGTKPHVQIQDVIMRHVNEL